MTTECRAVGVLERGYDVQFFANLLRSLCFNYVSHSAHEVVLRAPLAASAAGTTLRFTRRIPYPIFKGQTAKPPNPFQDELPERWEVRHEGAYIKGPILNELPAAMREVVDSACYGSSALEFWKALGAKQEQELYREGNEYNIMFQGYEIKVVLAVLYMVTEPGRVDRGSLKSASGSYTVDVSCRVPEGKHYEGANVVGAFAATLLPYVKLTRAEV